MKLSRKALKHIHHENVLLPSNEMFSYEEKILQFGTGSLLRGLPDYFIDKANRSGLFKGRIVLVKSTSYGDASDFAEQNNLYTLGVRGNLNGKKINDNIIVGSISRVLTASQDWKTVMACAQDPRINIVISNTTEAGFQLVEEIITDTFPHSFPAKLLAYLYERYITFDGDPAYGMIIIPTELIPGNGQLLKQMLLKLAGFNMLEKKFSDWLINHNTFCNSLVDRIVPGSMDTHQLGYQDRLAIVTEPYRLWAIEGNKQVEKTLSFAAAGSGIIVASDIFPYVEMKLRFLNGTHTCCCALAILAGLTTVQETVNDFVFGKFVKKLMQEELIHSVSEQINKREAQEFCNILLERFCNPFILHEWKSISFQYTFKMRLRVIPMLVNYSTRNQHAPQRICLSIAAYLCFFAPGNQAIRKHVDDHHLLLQKDDLYNSVFSRWSQGDTKAAVHSILSDVHVWNQDLSLLPGVSDAVTFYVNRILNEDIKELIRELSE